MFGSDALEVAIGLVFVYLLFSLACSTLTESVAQLLRIRPGMLESAIRNMLAGATPDRWEIGDQFYAGGRIKTLSQPSWLDRALKRPGRPSYIPARVFVLGLFDTLTNPGPDHRFWHAVKQIESATVQTEMEQALRSLWAKNLNIRKLQNPATEVEQKKQRALQTLITEKVTESEIRQALLKILAGGVTSTVTTKADKQEKKVRGEIRKLVDDLPYGEKKSALVKFLEDNPSADEIGDYDLQNAARRTFVQLRESATALDADLPLRQILLQNLDTAEEQANNWNDALSQVRLETAFWFEDVMERVTGWYRRKAKYWVFAWAILVTLIFNIDTLAIGSALYTDVTLREVVVDAADAFIVNNPAPVPVSESVALILSEPLSATIPASTTVESEQIGATVATSPTLQSAGQEEMAEKPTLGDLQQQIESLGLPIGWVHVVDDSTEKGLVIPILHTTPIISDTLFHGRNLIVTRLQSDDVAVVIQAERAAIDARIDRARRYRQVWPRTTEEAGKKVAGLLLTIIALSLGAPFWFDVLGRLASLRSAGKPPSTPALPGQGGNPANPSGR